VTEAIGAFAHLIPKPGSGHSPRTVLPIFNTNNFPKINFSSSKPNGFYRVADKSLVRPGRKQSTATKLLTFASHSKKKFRRLSVQPGLRGSNDLRVGRKMVTFQLFFFSRVGLRTYQHTCVCTTRINTCKFYVLPTQCINVFYMDLRTNNDYFVVCFLLGNSPASEFYMPTFRSTLSVPSS